MKCGWKQIVAGILLTGIALPLSAQQVQVPTSIATEVKAIEDQFRNVLEAECAEPRCYHIGCELGRFETIDQTQGSSLPGLDVAEKPAAAVQYSLRSVECAFSHEAALSDADVATLKQRLQSRVRPAGVNLLLNARRLAPKTTLSDVAAMDTKPLGPVVDPREDFWGALGVEILPFIPWFLIALLTCGFVLAIVWGVRRLGVERTDLAVAQGDPSTGALVLAKPATPPVSPFTIMTKSEELKKVLLTDSHLAEATLKPLMDAEKIDELCSVVRHFGSDVLAPFRKRPQYEKALMDLSAAYNESSEDTDAGSIWSFLVAMERRLVAAKIRIDQQPLSEEFAFLEKLELDELGGLLQHVSENEAILALTYCPRGLREKFFAALSPELMASYIERFTIVEKLPDAYARETAQRLRKIYEEEFSSLRTVKIEQVPLLETAINSMKPKARKELVDGLLKQTPHLIGLVSSHIVLDSTLLAVPGELLTEAFLSVSPEDAGAYLASFDEGAIVRGKLSPKLGESIGRYMTDENALKIVRVERARDKIAEFVKQKDAEGAISLKAINTRILGGDEGAS